MSKTSHDCRFPRWLLVGAATLLLVGSSALAQVWIPIRAQMVPIGSSTELPVVDEHLVIDIDAQHATVRLQQVFHNTTGMSVEGRYTLWAGPGARANGFAYWNGEQKIVGEVFEKNTARQVYQRVVQRRRDPGLLEEKSEGEFSFAVAPITPDERKRVEVTYSRWLQRRNGVVEVVAPVSRENADVQVTISDNRQLKNIASATHQIEVKQLASGKILVRSKKQRPEAKYFALHYEVEERPWTVNAYVHRNKGQDAYFALTLAAPVTRNKAALSKDVTLVIDRSGSMMGEKISQAREACIKILKGLGNEDRVNVMMFDDTVERLFKVPEPVNPKNRAKAIEYVELVREGGGTSLDAALLAALSAQVDGPQPRVVLFFTDGQSTPEPVIAAATQDKHDVRVFTIGLGRDINRPLLSRLAALKRGRFTYIPEAANIEREVGALYAQIGSPLLIDFDLESKNGTVINTYPRALPDLFNNDELLITGRLRGKGTVDLVLNAKENGKAVSYRTEVALVDDIVRPWVGRLWAKSRIDDLLDEINLKGSNHELIEEVTNLALAYNFATPYTSFLAIPESEIDAVSAQEMATARARKRELMQRKSGAAALAESEAGNAPASVAAPQPMPQMAPVQMAPAAPVQETADMAPTMAADDSSSEPLSRVKSQSVKEMEMDRKGGCASCSLGGHADGRDLAGVGLLVAVFGMLLSRRRSRR
jgi:Ca-activated chloride channel homolog